MNLRLPGQFPRFPVPADRWLRRITFGLLALLALVLLTHRVFNSDVWWHLKTGERILSGEGIPRTDPYTYTVAGQEWIDMHWGFQVLLALLFRLAGPLGFNLYLYAAIGGALFITVRNQYDRQYWSISALFLLLLLLTANPRFLVRPEALTFLCLSSVSWLLLHARDPGGERWLWLLPPVIVVWANVQGLYILGVLLLLLTVAGEVLRRILPIPMVWEVPEPLPPAQWGRLGVMSGVCVLAGLATPYSVRGLFFPFTLFTRVSGQQNVFSQVIAEFQPPFSGGAWTAPTEMFLLYFVIASAVFVANARRMSIDRWLTIFAFGFLAFAARRNVPVALLVLTPLAVAAAVELVRDAERTTLWDVVGVCTWAQAGIGVVVCVAALWHIPLVLSDAYYVDDRRGERFGLGVADTIYPGPALDFVAEHDLPGPLFNSMYIGGYAIYRFAPERHLVSLDSRLEVHTETTLGAYVAAARGAQELDGLLQLYRAQTAVITHNSADAGNLFSSFVQLPDWELVHVDACGAVFVREAVRRERAIPRLRFPVDLDVAARPVPATLAGPVPAWATAVTAAVNRIHLGPRFPTELFNMAALYLQLGGAEAAVPLFEAGLAQYPRTAFGWYNLGKAHQDLRQFAEARAAYERAVALHPRLSAAWVNLGLLTAVEGDASAARPAYERAVQADEHNVAARYNLAAALVQAEEYARAYQHYKVLTRQMPRSGRWWFEFGRTCRRLGHFAEGEEALERALSLEPRNVAYWLELSDLLYADAQAERGRAALRRAYEVAPDAPAVRRRMRDMGAGPAP